MFAFTLASRARSCMAMKLGIAMAARMPMMTTTIISSIRVKPFEFRMTLQPPPESLPPVNLWLLRPMVTSIGYATPSYAGVRLDFRLGRDGGGLPECPASRRMQRTGLHRVAGSVDLRWNRERGGFLGAGT